MKIISTEINLEKASSFRGDVYEVDSLYKSPSLTDSKSKNIRKGFQPHRLLFENIGRISFSTKVGVKEIDVDACSIASNDEAVLHQLIYGN